MCEVSCECALRCFSTLTTEQRRTIFSRFWALGNFDIQNTYLCGCVKVLPVARHYTSESKRGNTRVYYVNNSERSVRICKTAFLRIHGISCGRLSRVLAGQAEQGGLPKLDTRGRHEPPNKTSSEDKAFIRQHIKSFPVYQSHYSRSDNLHRRYLSPDLSQAKMYHLYKEKCNENGCRPVSDWVYRKTFCEEFNLSFGRYVTHADNTHFPPTHSHVLSQPTHFILTCTQLHTHTHTLTSTCMHTPPAHTRTAPCTHTASTHMHARSTHAYTHHLHTRTAPCTPPCTHTQHTCMHIPPAHTACTHIPPAHSMHAHTTCTHSMHAQHARTYHLHTRHAHAYTQHKHTHC